MFTSQQDPQAQVVALTTRVGSLEMNHHSSKVDDMDAFCNRNHHNRREGIILHGVILHLGVHIGNSETNIEILIICQVIKMRYLC